MEFLLNHTDEKQILNNIHNHQSVKNPKILLCFSHLRWDFVYQRPQHLLSRFSKDYTVFFFEEPVFDSPGDPSLTFLLRADNLWVVVPHLPTGTPWEKSNQVSKRLLDNLLAGHDLNTYIFWYYTPMALSFSSHLKPSFIVYDCMDELSNFKFAPPELRANEAELFNKADIVFTGGHSLYEAKKNKHKNIFPFPSSIDKSHFEQARQIEAEPEDQQNIPHPRLGFYGVIDERFDIDLISKMAVKKPEWHFVLLGPVVKIDQSTLPDLPNVHFLGSKSYNDLPAYLSGWDVALIPFLLNEATRYISPTKTPEYLSAGVPVISTPIQDVVSPYGEEGLVKIAGTDQEFIDAAEELLNMDIATFLPVADAFLSKQSWTLTFEKMKERISQTLNTNTILN
ncbi:MAG: glycosyltransferase family 1 protein [Chitinophagaceae bacterium]|nr:glycosyltransferase family 1 protein [Chitinophagaceae bacterium]